MKPGENILI